METDQARKESSQSRKVAVVSSGIAAIVAKDDFRAQCVVAVVVVAFIVVQGFLDYRKRERAGQ